MEPVTTVDFSQKTKNIYDNIVKQEEFTEIFELYYKRVYNYTYYRVNSQEVGEDLTSQIFEKIMLNLNTYIIEKSKFEVWMFAIARNTINDYFRKQKRHKIISIDSILDLVSKDKGPENLIINKERNNKLMNALNVLDAKERNIIAYKFGANLKNTEIAKILNSYLPEGYTFKNADFTKDELGNVKDSKYASLHFANQTTGKEIYIQERFACDETKTYEDAENIEKITINGVDAILSNGRNIDWEADNTIYYVGGKNIGKDEAIKVAESIK